MELHCILDFIFRVSFSLQNFYCPEQVLDGKPDKVVIVKDNVQKSVDEASIKDTVVTTATPVEAANGKMTKLEEDKSVAAVEDAANKGSKSAVTSCGKTGSPNGVASAC